MARDVEKHQLVAGSREIVLFSHADSLHSPYPDQVLVCQWRSAPNSAFVYYREWLDGETKRTSDTGHPPPLGKDYVLLRSLTRSFVTSTPPCPLHRRQTALDRNLGSSAL